MYVFCVFLCYLMLCYVIIILYLFFHIKTLSICISFVCFLCYLMLCYVIIIHNVPYFIVIIVAHLMYDISHITCQTLLVYVYLLYCFVSFYVILGVYHTYTSFHTKTFSTVCASFVVFVLSYTILCDYHIQ